MSDLDSGNVRDWMEHTMEKFAIGDDPSGEAAPTDYWRGYRACLDDLDAYLGEHGK